MKGTLRYANGGLGLQRGWTSKTRSSLVVSAKEKILRSKQFSLGKAMAIFTFHEQIVSTFKDARTILLESYLDGVIDDDEFILLHDEISKNPELPYEFIFYHYLQYKNTETTQLTALVPLQCCLCRFQFHLLFFSFFNLILSSLTIWFKFSATSSHFFPLATVLFFVSVKGSENMIYRRIISSWRELRTIGFLKTIRIYTQAESVVKNEIAFQLKWNCFSKGKHRPTVRRYKSK